MTWLLRLFPAYRELVRERDWLTAAYECEVRSADATSEHYRREMKAKDERIAELTSQLVESTQKSADFVAKMKYGRSIFGDMPDVAIDLEHQRPIEHPRRQAYDLVKEAEKQFAESLRPKATPQTN